MYVESWNTVKWRWVKPSHFLAKVFDPTFFSSAIIVVRSGANGSTTHGCTTNDDFAIVGIFGTAIICLTSFNFIFANFSFDIFSAYNIQNLILLQASLFFKSLNIPTINRTRFACTSSRSHRCGQSHHFMNPFHRTWFPVRPSRPRPID